MAPSAGHASDSLGYGYFSYKRGDKTVKIRAHRFMWRITYGKFDSSLEVCHNCPTGDNTLCVNPHHLFLGTHKDNMNDMVSKNRQNFGERNGQHKLTELEVLRIRALRTSGMTQQSIADMFNVTRENIRNIEHRKIWKYLA